MDKLNELNKSNSTLDGLVEKVNSQKKKLERNIRSNYTELTEKIKGIEGKKVAVLSYESSSFQSQINSLQTCQAMKSLTFSDFYLDTKK